MSATGRYVTVSVPNAMIWATPDAAVAPQYYATPGGAYEVVATANGFVQVVWIGGEMGWVSDSDVMPYDGVLPPPVAMLGLAVQLSRESERVPSGDKTFSSSQIREFLQEIDHAEGDPRDGSPLENHFSGAAPPAAPARMATADVSALHRRQARLSRYKYRIADQEWFRFPPKPVSRYPDMDVDGFVELKLSGRDYSPKYHELSSTDNRWQIIQNDPVYRRIPQNVLVGNPRFDMRLKLGMEGQLSEDLSVRYDIEQEPEFPGRYDIEVHYKNTHMTFYHFDTEFYNGEFINLRRALNGAQVVHKDPFWEGRIAVGKQRSEPKKYESFGNGRSAIQVGVRSLLPDSVKVWVNGGLKKEGVDYTVNYYEGEVKFTTIKSATDYVEIIYEFTNPIEDFIPVLSRRNFFGAQYLWRSAPEERRIKKSQKHVQSFVVTSANRVVDDTGALDLAAFPVVLGSEFIRLNGAMLRRNTDYVLRQGRGKLQLKIPLREADVLEVAYDAYDTVFYHETIVGKDVPGPYVLGHRDVLDGSVAIKLNGQALSEIRDYTVDYEAGRVLFNYAISYPSILSVSYGAILTETQKTSTANVSPFTVGVTYLDEYVKGDTTDLVQRVASESHTVTGNTLYLRQFPLTQTDTSLVVVLNGVLAVVGQDYVVADAYRGHIQLLKSGVTSAVVSYAVRKSFSTTFVFQARANRNVYENNTPEFTLRDVPVRYRGVTRVRLAEGVTEEVLIEGQDYDILYGENGNVGFKLVFYRRGDTIGAVRSDYPADGARITLVYDNTPDQVPDQGTILQRQVGITGGMDISSKWRVDAEFSAAENNFSKPRLFTTVSFKGNGQDGNLYDLGKVGVVDNTEAVYINGIRQTKDQNYSVNYNTGKLRFVNLNPTAQDEIRVDFEYFDTTGQTQSGQSNYSYATKVGTTYRDEGLSARADLKVIDKNYLPISPIQERKGTVSLGSGVDFVFDPQTAMGVDYRKREEIQPPTQIKNDIYLHTDDVRTYVRYSPLPYTDVRHDVRYYVQYQDATSDEASANRHAVDQQSLEQQTVISAGPDFFKNNIHFSQSRVVNGYLDGYDREERNTYLVKWNADMVMDRMPWLTYLKLQPVYERSETTTLQTFTQSNTKKKVVDLNEIIGLDILNRPIDKLSLHAFYNVADSLKYEEGVTPAYTRSLNYQYDTLYDPFVWLRLAFSHRQREEQSALLGQKGRITTDLQYRVDNFVPHSFFRYLGAQDDSWWIVPLKGSFASYSQLHNRILENNDRRSQSSQAQRVDVRQLHPLPGVSFSVLTYETQNSGVSDTVQTQTTSENSSSRVYERQAVSVSVKPPVPLLDHFVYTLALESRSESRKQSALAQNGTSNITEEFLPVSMRDQALSYQIGRFVLPVFWLFDLDFGGLTASVQDILDDSVNQRKTHVYSTTSSNIRQAQEDSQVLRRVYVAKLNPFRLFGVEGRYNTEDARYNRNIDPANTGLTYKMADTLGTSAQMNPFSFLSVDSRYTRQHVTQYRSPFLNLSLGDIRRAETEGNLTRFRDFLYQTSDTVGTDVVFRPLSWFSLKLGAEVGDIQESSRVGTANLALTKIAQKTGIVGVGVYPLQGLSILYDYSLRLSAQNSGSEQEGYGGKLSVTYSPVKTATFQVDLTYERTDAWGRNLNTLERKETEQGTGDVIRSQLIETNNTVEYGSVNANVIIPMPDTPYVENITLTAEGYIKRITDRLDAQKKAAGQQALGYDITGMIFKMVINF